LQRDSCMFSYMEILTTNDFIQAKAQQENDKKCKSPFLDAETLMT
jgi:hypothetical protein